MTCNFAMRECRNPLCDAGLNRSTRVWASQTTEVRGSEPRARQTSGGAAALPPSSAARQACARTPAVALVDFLRAAAGARCRRRGLGRAVAVGAVLGERQRRLHLELILEPRAALFPAFLVLELVLVQGGRLLDAVRVTELDRE